MVQKIFANDPHPHPLTHPSNLKPLTIHPTPIPPLSTLLPNTYCLYSQHSLTPYQLAHNRTKKTLALLTTPHHHHQNPKNMPPKRTQRQAIWPTHRLPNYTKNVYTTIWGPASQLLLLEAVANAIKGGKLDLWKKLKRHPFYYTTLGQAQYTPTQLKTNYNNIVKEDSETMSVGNTILPMLKTQRRFQIAQDYIHLTQSNVVHPPLYGPRFGQADSDDEFPEPAQREEYLLNNNNTTAPPRQPSLAITQLSSLETPGFIARVEDVTMKALRGKLQGPDYQTSLMRARMDYKNTFGVDLDPVAIPPVDGITYLTLPPPPTNPA